MLFPYQNCHVVLNPLFSDYEFILSPIPYEFLKNPLIFATSSVRTPFNISTAAGLLAAGAGVRDPSDPTDSASNVSVGGPLSYLTSREIVSISRMN